MWSLGGYQHLPKHTGNIQIQIIHWWAHMQASYNTSKSYLPAATLLWSLWDIPQLLLTLAVVDPVFGSTRPVENEKRSHNMPESKLLILITLIIGLVTIPDTLSTNGSLGPRTCGTLAKKITLVGWFIYIYIPGNVTKTQVYWGTYHPHPSWRRFLVNFPESSVRSALTSVITAARSCPRIAACKGRSCLGPRLPRDPSYIPLIYIDPPI